jgi:hypothetical protein
MELDFVDPVSVAIVRAQDRRVLVRLAAELDRLAARERPDLARLVARPLRALALERLYQHLVLLEDVVADERRRLVQHLVGRRLRARRFDDRHQENCTRAGGTTARALLEGLQLYAGTS